MFALLKKIEEPVSLKDLYERGILGINARNADYILPYNQRKYYPRVDDKVLTKTICQNHGIVVPELYFVIDCHSQIKHFETLLGQRQSFVIKPSRGAGGRGIMVIQSREKENYKSSSGKLVDSSSIKHHISTIISGLYSLSGLPDKAVVEERIVCHHAFQNIAVGGTPDIRIIIYRGIPVMAMLRLPTLSSGGRANLHQGAIGAGVNIVTGKTIRGVQKNRVITEHPDTKTSIADIEVPFWDDAVEMAIRLSDALELGYVGIDMVIDETKGPIVLEANARPGLAIQVSNGKGLLPVLKKVQNANLSGLSIDERIHFLEK